MLELINCWWRPIIGTQFAQYTFYTEAAGKAIQGISCKPGLSLWVLLYLHCYIGNKGDVTHAWLGKLNRAWLYRVNIYNLSVLRYQPLFSLVFLLPLWHLCHRYAVWSRDCFSGFVENNFPAVPAPLCSCQNFSSMHVTLDIPYCM